MRFVGRVKKFIARNKREFDLLLQMADDDQAYTAYPPFMTVRNDADQKEVLAGVPSQLELSLVA